MESALAVPDPRQQGTLRSSSRSTRCLNPPRAAGKGHLRLAQPGVAFRRVVLSGNAAEGQTACRQRAGLRPRPGTTCADARAMAATGGVSVEPIGEQLRHQPAMRLARLRPLLPQDELGAQIEAVLCPPTVIRPATYGLQRVLASTTPCRLSPAPKAVRRMGFSEVRGLTRPDDRDQPPRPPTANGAAPRLPRCQAYDPDGAVCSSGAA